MFGDIEVDDPPAMVGKHHEDEQDAEAHGGHGEEIERPPLERPESWVQYLRNRRRCHRRTVSGVTITRACLHPAQALASQIQKSRSVGRSLGRVVVRL